MKIQYFRDTNTLYIEFREQGIVETRELDPDTTIDLDTDGNVVAITFEHASRRTDVEQVTVEGLAA
jgi:uncharacterized protein YuzE